MTPFPASEPIGTDKKAIAQTTIFIGGIPMSNLLPIDNQTQEILTDPVDELYLDICEACGGSNMTRYFKQEVFYLVCEDCDTKCLND